MTRKSKILLIQNLLFNPDLIKFIASLFDSDFSYVVAFIISSVPGISA